MKRRLTTFCFLFGVLFFNPVFSPDILASDTFIWIGGSFGEWTDNANWHAVDANMDGVAPAFDGDVVIDGSITVTISAPNDIVIESVVLANGGSLIIASGAKLTTRKGGSPGSNGFRLDGVSGTESTLYVNGTLNINTASTNAPASGLYINDYSSVSVGATGALNILNTPEFGIKLNDDLINYGVITISNCTESGIETTSPVSGGCKITNYGTLIIDGSGTDAIYLAHSTVSIDNFGTVTLSGANDKLLDGSGEFFNYGTFGGNGTVEADDFIPQSGSTISPGTSIGTLTFDNDLDLTGVTLLIEINGENTYDQLIVQGEITLDPSTSTLQFGGTYDFAPAPMGDFGIMTSTTGQITGNFTTTSYTLNGAVLTQSTGFAVSFSNFLPVELTAFTAQPLGKAVQLRWSTATETNNDYFSIEHSTDGRYFTEIGRVGGAGTSQELHFYSFVHDAPAKGMNYYRLDQHDYDGGRQYSNIEAIFFGEKNHWTAYPTLARDLVNVEWQEVPNRRSVVEAFNLSGQMVYRQVAPSQSAVLQIPVADWAPGMYWLMVQSNGKVEVQQFMKE